MDNVSDENDKSIADNSTDENTKLSDTLNLEQLINSYMLDLEKLQKDLKEQSSMMRDLFENDAEYKKVQEDAKKIAKQKKQIKDKLMGDQSFALVDAKASELKLQVKEVKQALSDYLYTYYKESGITQFIASDGAVHEMVTSVRLVKKKE